MTHVVEKPPYRIPTMSEIAAIPSNGYRVASTFSGAGGSCLGYRMAGFRVVWANEFIEAARETYRANASDCILDARDIRTIEPIEILEAIGINVGELDILDGSPPCASFSSAGKREKGWGKVRDYSDGAQRSDDLFYEYIRLLRGLQPRAFVAENVSGLVKGTAKGYFKNILAEFKVSGYRVRASVLDAQWLGVPQARQRVIFIGLRDDLSGEPSHPMPLPYRYSVRDALPELGAARVIHDTGGQPEYSAGNVTDRPAPTIVSGGHHLHVETESDMSGYAVGKEWDNIRQGKASLKYFSLKHAHPDKPAQTVTASGGLNSVASVTHPVERRKFSIDELRQISSFPNDFILTGSYSRQWERIGRAVPPTMMYHIAAHIRDAMLLPLG